MTKLYLNVLFFLMVISLSFGQTAIEKKEIIKSYDISKIETLKDNLKVKNQKNEEAIKAYLLRNPHVKRIVSGENGKISEIKYILNDTPIYVTTDNISSAIATRTNFLHNGGNLGLNLEGQNMHVATWDGGPTLASHQEFLDDGFPQMPRVDNPDLSSSNDRSNHSTHVSGTIIAKGVNSIAKGMAPQATLTSYDWDFDDVEALDQASTNGLLLSNHSYGVPTQTNPTLNYLMGSYNDEARTWDNVAYNAPYYLQVVSAGNNGTTSYTGGLANNYDKLVGNKNSKNNLVVANGNNPFIQNDGNGTLISLFINTGSSQGPTDDGRIKPDITADGTSVTSPIGTSSTAYASYNGTSMSAPNTTGTLLLLQQYYNQLNSQYMRASTLKGLACHTADDDFSSPGPDPIFGWGLLNAKAAAETIAADHNGNALIEEITLNQGQTYTYNFTATSTQPLSATICWTDPPGITTTTLNSPTSRLINDLDLRISNTSTTFLPWKLNLSNVAGFATTGDNLVDTVENIDIASPVSGSYTITVSHKGFLTDGAQTFSLILTGSELTLGNEVQNATYGFMSWPNPATNELNFKYNAINNFDAKVSLVDVQGRVVYKNTLTTFDQIVSGKINTSEYANGLYFLNIEQGDAKLSKKIIIK